MFNKELFRKPTDCISIISNSGIKQGEIILPEKIIPISGKRGGYAETGTYYKGSGIVYQGHTVNSQEAGLKYIDKTGIIYEKYAVSYPKLIGKHGIFLFPHQPIFTDCEGGCGKKESNLLINYKNFEHCAIDEIVNVIDTGIVDHKIYAYRLKDVKQSPNDVGKLIEYILYSNYNTAWDKNLWSDVYAYSYVRDVADWFVSCELKHKIGTVYALLNSLYRTDMYLYTNLIRNILGIYNSEKIHIIYFSALIVKKFCPELFLDFPYDIDKLTSQVYGELLKLLFIGKACCHLEDDGTWNWVRDSFCSRIESCVSYFKKVFE